MALATSGRNELLDLFTRHNQDWWPVQDLRFRARNGLSGALGWVALGYGLVVVGDQRLRSSAERPDAQPAGHDEARAALAPPGTR